MTQCAGTTLKGERCKREAREGSDYCSIHFERATPPNLEPEPATASGPTASREASHDRDWMTKAALALAALATIILFRVRR
jgi:hypothetical protein